MSTEMSVYMEGLSLGAVHFVNQTVMAPILAKLRGMYGLLREVLHRPSVELVEFSRFMALKALKKDHAARKLSPTVIMDEIWHALMQRPVAYDTFCMELCGQTVDHRPVKNCGRAARVFAMQELYTNVFRVKTPVYGKGEKIKTQFGGSKGVC